MKLTGESRSCARPLPSLVSHVVTSRSGSRYGSGRNTTRSSSVNTAVVAPTPSASASTADAVKPGLRRNRRQPKRMSCRSWSISRFSRRLRADRWQVDSMEREALAERPLRDQTLVDNAPRHEMLLDDALENRRIALAIPRALGVDDGNRTAFTDAKTVRFGSQNAALLREPELLEASLQKRPCDEPALLVAALGLRLIAAEKDVPAGDRNAD